MAKRMIDTEMYKKGFVKNLCPKYKLLWTYLLLECDYCGLWNVELDVASLRLGFDFSEDEVLDVFSGKIYAVKDDKWFLPSFIEFQYGELNSSNRVHNSVVNNLKNKGVRYPLEGVLDGAKDIYKDIDKDKEKEKEKENFTKEKEKVDEIFDEKKCLTPIEKLKTDQTKFELLQKGFSRLADFDDLCQACSNKIETDKNNTEWQTWKMETLYRRFSQYLNTVRNGRFSKSNEKNKSNKSGINEPSKYEDRSHEFTTSKA